MGWIVYWIVHFFSVPNVEKSFQAIFQLEYEIIVIGIENFAFIE